MSTIRKIERNGTTSSHIKNYDTYKDALKTQKQIIVAQQAADGKILDHFKE